ncbi:lmo0937 family membrane protein [Halolactibacillus halophilus]
MKTIIKRGDEDMLWTIIGILLLIWLVGFVLDVAGGLVHILLVVALIVFIYNMITGRKR